mmetsp:Transcript_15460/g.25265  ORF Transcript_15460/g.25265 Transcript_15460/m.25265 type:complete len:337 (+) Transcript_15460:267-1277(+)
MPTVIEQILDDEIARALARPNGDPGELVDFTSCEILDKKAIPLVLKLLAKLFPLPEEWGHVKRIRPVAKGTGGYVRVLLGRSPSDGSSIVKGCADASIEDTKILGEKLGAQVVVKLPKYKPRTIDEAKLWSRDYWPVAFSSSKSDLVAKRGLGIVDNIYDEEPRISRWMDKVSSYGGKAVALIIDPVSDTVVAEGFDRRKEEDHPLRHACMVCIGKASEKVRQTRVAYNLGKYQARSDFNPKRRKVDTDTLLERFDPISSYLCTDLELYTFHEPCKMCSMALLHSRIKRVFYKQPSPGTGALGSERKLHCIPQLNHHFEVFKVTSCDAKGVQGDVM